MTAPRLRTGLAACLLALPSACSTAGAGAGDGGPADSAHAEDVATPDASRPRDGKAHDSPGPDRSSPPDAGGDGRDPFFALGVGHSPPAHPWPTVSFGTVRLWDSGVAWALLETSPGVYDWTALDAWLGAAEAHGVDVLYTFGRTPSFASSQPSLACAEGAGECAPPSDLSADGTGTDARFKTFAAALVAHAGARIRYYEVWNEANNVAFWVGTAAQLVRLAFDLRAALAKAGVAASVLTPSMCNCDNSHLTGKPGTNPQGGMDDYLATPLPASVGAGTGASLADGVAFHPYLGKPEPEGIVALTKAMKATMTSHGAGALPLWDTESSWGKNALIPGCPDAGVAPFSATCSSNMADFLARSLTLARGEGVARFSWYQWDNRGEGTLWDPTAGALPAAAVYGEVEAWLAGATSSPCSQTAGGVWTCALQRAGGYRGEIVWDTNGPSAFAPPPGLTQSETLAGAVSKPLVGPVTIGTTPLLLENMNRPAP